jgi:hypothetical protein
LEGSEFKDVSAEALDILSQLLEIDVEKRIDAEEALNH